MAADETLKKVLDKIDGYRDLAIELETQMTAIPALAPENDGKGEAEKAKLIRRFLEELKPDRIEEVNCPDDRVPDGYRPNLLAWFEGEDPSRTIWIMTHMDVVPPGDLNMWKSDPYKVVVEGDKIIGRGVEDNQQGIVSSILAMRALREAGVKPAHTVCLAIVADEETGSKYGLQYLLKEKRDAFKKEDLIIIPDAGNEDGTMIEVAEKSILWLKFTTIGKQCHASTPEQGINAHRAAAHLIVKLDRLYDIFNQRNEVFEPPISTFEPTKKEANVPNVNTIPGEDVFYLDCRVLPEIPLSDVMDKINEMIREVEEQFKVKIKTESPQTEEAAPPTPSDAPVVLALKKAIKDVTGRDARAMGIGGGTVAAYVRREGLHAAVWSTLDEMAHQPNEYAKLSNILSDAKVFAHVFLQK
ncbi:MAG TPA: M20 family metallo-hydrolase [Bacteroidetes bacterium]|nr:M20 family metallo-hydrolase [Bacteroidota bacterium]